MIKCPPWLISGLKTLEIRSHKRHNMTEEFTEEEMATFETVLIALDELEDVKISNFSVSLRFIHNYIIKILIQLKFRMSKLFYFTVCGGMWPKNCRLPRVETYFTVQVQDWSVGWKKTNHGLGYLAEGGYVFIFYFFIL